MSLFYRFARIDSGGCGSGWQSAAGAEEGGEERAALFGEEAGGDFDLVVELGVVEDAEDRTAGAGLGVGRGVDQACDAGVEDGAGAHGAGFEGDVEGAALVFAFLIDQAIVGEGAGGVAESDDLCVGGGVVIAQDTVLAASDDLAVVDDDGADGDFARALGGAGFGDAGAEVVEVGVEVESHHGF